MLSKAYFVLTASSAGCIVLYAASASNGNYICSKLDLLDSAHAVETPKKKYERLLLPLAMQGMDLNHLHR